MKPIKRTHAYSLMKRRNANCLAVICPPSMACPRRRTVIMAGLVAGGAAAAAAVVDVIRAPSTLSKEDLRVVADELVFAEGPNSASNPSSSERL